MKEEEQKEEEQKEEEQTIAKNKKPIYKRWWFIVLILLMAGGLLMDEEVTPKSSSNSSNSSNSSTGNKVESPKIVDLRISCPEILLQIESNEAKAKSMYSNKNILINGTIGRVESSFFDTSIVHLTHTDEWSIQQCSLFGVGKDYVLTISKGEWVQLLCDSFGESLGDANLFNCAPYKR